MKQRSTRRVIHPDRICEEVSVAVSSPCCLHLVSSGVTSCQPAQRLRETLSHTSKKYPDILFVSKRHQSPTKCAFQKKQTCAIICVRTFVFIQHNFSRLSVRTHLALVARCVRAVFMPFFWQVCAVGSSSHSADMQLRHTLYFAAHFPVVSCAQTYTQLHSCAPTAGDALT